MFYSLTDVASFSRWYLCDYPVRVWKKGGNSLCVCIAENMYSKYVWEFRIEEIDKIPVYIKCGFFLNISVIVFFILALGWRFYKALKLGRGD